MKVENFKRFSLKMLRCEARAFPVGTAIERLHVTSQPRLSAILVHNQILPFTDEMVNFAVVRCS